MQRSHKAPKVGSIPTTSIGTNNIDLTVMIPKLVLKVYIQSKNTVTMEIV